MSIKIKKYIDIQLKVVYYSLGYTTKRSIRGDYMNIKKLRLKNNWSQQKLSEKLNVSQQTIAKWENEKCFPRSELLPVIASIFNCKIEDLY